MEPVDEFVTPDEAHHEPPPAVDTMADSGGMEAQTPTPEIDQVTPEPDLQSADTTELERDPYRQEAAATGIEQPEQQWNAAPDHSDHDVSSAGQWSGARGQRLRRRHGSMLAPRPQPRS